MAQEQPRITDAEAMLDDALCDLSKSDRDVVLLRYHDGLDVPEVAHRLGVPTATAAKRLSRAVGRLRDFFARNGVSCSVAAASQMLAAIGRTPVPPELFQTIADTALGKSAASALTLSIFERTVQMIRRTQMKWIVGGLAAVLAIGGGGVAGTMLAITGRGAADGLNAVAAEAKVDARSPREILKAFAAAIRASDAEAMRPLVHVETAWEKELLDAVCRSAGAARSLRAAVAKAFGTDAAAMLDKQKFGPVDGFAEAVEQTVDHIEPTIDGDYATFAPPGMAPDEAFILERVNGAWRISGKRMTELWTDDQKRDRLQQVQNVGMAFEKLTQELKDEKYATMAEFAAAVQEMFGRR